VISTPCPDALSLATGKGLAKGPAIVSTQGRFQIAAGKNMDMNVGYGLPGPAPEVYHQPVTVFHTLILLYNLIYSQKKIGDNAGLVVRYFVQGSVMRLGNDQKVQRRLRVNIMKRESMLVFVNDFGRDLPGDDFTEQTVVHGFVLLFML
jgi:hypothetical protein